MDNEERKREITVKVMKGLISMVEDNINNTGDQECFIRFDGKEKFLEKPEEWSTFTRFLNKLDQTSFIKSKAFSWTLNGSGEKDAVMTFTPSRLLPLLKFISSYDRDQEVFKLISESDHERSMRETKYWVKRKNKGRTIILNDKYILGTPDFESENDRFFDYMYEHPGRIVDTKVLEKIVKSHKKISQITGQLGFKGELKKLFFPVSKKNTVSFRHKVTADDLENINVNQAKLDQQIEHLKILGK